MAFATLAPAVPLADRGAGTGRTEGAAMAWWGWLLVTWPVVAVLAACVLGPALRNSDHREWIRRGRPERRTAPRRRDREQA